MKGVLLTSAILFQIIVNLLLFAFVGLIWSRLKHLSGDEGRLRQGLQILQSKIAILEDLSGQVDDQFKQLTYMLDLKSKAFDAKLTEASELLSKLADGVTEASAAAHNLSENLQPEVLLERETAIRYVKAALLARAGKSTTEISSQLGVGFEEAELICKLNRSQLQFKVDELPEWMKPQLKNELALLETKHDMSPPAEIDFALKKHEIKAPEQQQVKPVIFNRI